MAVSTNTWSPHPTGELQLRPAMSIFQATFSVVLQVSGSFGSSAATPADRSPRNCGQCCAPAGAARSMATRAIAAFVVQVMPDNIHPHQPSVANAGGDWPPSANREERV